MSHVCVGTIDTNGASVYVVAERPEALVETVRDMVASAGSRDPSIVSIDVDDLPSRAQGLASADVIVWQDVESSGLDAQRLDALRAWLATGGHLVIFGGSTGIATLTGFPEEMLPYRPERVADVPPTDVQAIFGTLPAASAAVPAVIGPTVEGTTWRAAPMASSPPALYGQGCGPALIGVDPRCRRSMTRPPRSRSGPASCRPPGRRRISSSAAVMSSSCIRWAACRRCRCLNSSSSQSWLLPMSSPSALSTTSSCAVATAASGRG